MQQINIKNKYIANDTTNTISSMAVTIFSPVIAENSAKNIAPQATHNAVNG